MILCGCSNVTLRRYDRSGKLPNRQVGDDGIVRYAVSDLVAAGLLDPTASVSQVVERVHPRPDDHGSPGAGSQMADAEARIAELTARLARAEEEVAYWRSLHQRSVVA